MKGKGKGASKGGETSDSDMEMCQVLDRVMNPSAVAPPSHAHIQGQKLAFWFAEQQSRVRNAQMTPYEESSLRDQLGQLPRLQKVINHFGLPHGTKACSEVLAHLVQEQGVMPGSMVPQESIEFVLCKHMWVAGIAEDQPDSLHQITNRNKCHCFSKIALMPQGCLHYKKALWLMPWAQSLCPTCTCCIRCGGLLGCISDCTMMASSQGHVHFCW